METRKIQLTGGSTYTVSLPKEWAAEHDLDAGTQVDLFPHIDGSLVVRASERQGDTATDVRIDAEPLTDSNLVRVLQSGYIAGYDVISLTTETGFDSRQRRAVRRTAQNLIGLEPIEETEGQVVLKSLLDASDVSIRQSLVQLQFTALSMQENAMAALFDGDRQLAEQVQNRDDEADRLFGMINRHFQRSLTDLGEIDALNVSRPTLFDYYSAARHLERIADHAVKIARIATQLDAVPSDDRRAELSSLADRSRKVVGDAMSVLLAENDVETAYTALEACDAITDELTAIDRTLYEGQNTAAYHLTLVLDSLIRIAEYGGNIAETAIQAAARDGTI